MAGQTRLTFVLAAAAAVLPACQTTTTEAPPPLAINCSAIPPSGQAPLSVAFGLDVMNALGTLGVSISYGDGAQGTDPNARHVYSVPGDYMASITVTAGAETARCSLPISVAPTPALTPSPTPVPPNRPPDALFLTVPAASGTSIRGKAPFLVSFNMCRTTDPDGDRLLFRMDLDGDGRFEVFGSSGADCRHEMTYAVGMRTATLCVADVGCPSWPICWDYPPLHPYQCRSYSVTAMP